MLSFHGTQRINVEHPLKVQKARENINRNSPVLSLFQLCFYLEARKGMSGGRNYFAMVVNDRYVVR